MAGALSFHTLERRLSRRARESFLFGTAMLIHSFLGLGFKQLLQRCQAGVAFWLAIAGVFVEICAAAVAKTCTIVAAKQLWW